MAILPFTVEEAGTVVYGAKHGLLHEALALVAIKSNRPQPILQEFGENKFNEMYLELYHVDVDVRNPMSVAIAHLAGYMFWYVEWNRIRRSAMMQHFGKCTGDEDSDSVLFGSDFHLDQKKHDCNVSRWTAEMDKAHNAWCKMHHINPSSVKVILHSVESALKTLYRSDFEPEWLRCQPPDPIWNRGRPITFRKDYSCNDGFLDVFLGVYGSREGQNMASSSLIKLQEKSLSQRKDVVGSEDFACIHFLAGSCKYGSRCKNVHSFSAPKPPCRFQSSCTNPSCLYDHYDEQSNDIDDDSMLDPVHGKFMGGAFEWYCVNSSSLLMVGEGDFSFCRALRSLQAQPLLTSNVINNLPVSSRGQYTDIIEVGLDATRCHMNKFLLNHPLNSRVSKCAWNFPRLDGSARDKENECLLAGFFMSMGAYFGRKSPNDHFEVGIAMQANEFSKWKVLTSAHNSGFSLEWWDYFDCSLFPNYSPKDSKNDPMKVVSPRFYVFRLRK